MQNQRVPRVLSIAGSDSGGGAGIQADLKAFARCGVHGMTAITAVTAQNTVDVTEVHQIPTKMILAQVKAVATDIGVDAVKVGMLANREVIDAVEEALEMIPNAAVVVDPVMIAESGVRLLEAGAVAALKEKIVPRSTVITPNIPEAIELSGLDKNATAEELASAVYALGPRAVVITGGHGDQSANDTFYDGKKLEKITGVLYKKDAAHGSGCTHSAAVAAYLAKGLLPLDAVREAKKVASEAVHGGIEEIGAGAGPVDALGITGEGFRQK